MGKLSPRKSASKVATTRSTRAGGLVKIFYLSDDITVIMDGDKSELVEGHEPVVIGDAGPVFDDSLPHESD